MRTYLNQTVEEAIGQFDNTNARERAIVTESLGSFVVLDALRGKQTRGFVEKASNLTFFANQFALLELARIGFSAAEGWAIFSSGRGRRVACR